MLYALFCHPFGAGYVIAFTRGFTLTISFQPFGPVVGRPFRMALLRVHIVAGCAYKQSLIMPSATYKRSGKT